MGRKRRDESTIPSLKEERLKRFELFRHNLPILRATTGLSAEKLGNALGFAKSYRLIDLEYGRATEPKMDELIAISQYFNITLDQLLFQKAVVSFVPLPAPESNAE